MTRTPQGSPVRRDVAKGASSEASQLLRWLQVEDAELWPDWSGRAPAMGRSVYTGPDAASVRAAASGGALARGMRSRLPRVAPEVLVERAYGQGERHWFERLGLARRAGAVAIGQLATSEAMRNQDGLVIVASDASEGTIRKYASNAGRAGLPCVRVPGERLGAALGREFVSVVMVSRRPFSQELHTWARALQTYPGTQFFVDEADVRSDRGKISAKSV